MTKGNYVAIDGVVVDKFSGHIEQKISIQLHMLCEISKALLISLVEPGFKAGWLVDR